MEISVDRRIRQFQRAVIATITRTKPQRDILNSLFQMEGGKPRISTIFPSRTPRKLGSSFVTH
jgi:hypothetical protein